MYAYIEQNYIQDTNRAWSWCFLNADGKVGQALLQPKAANLLNGPSIPTGFGCHGKSIFVLAIKKVWSSQGLNFVGLGFELSEFRVWTYWV
jgi:hypothetical protein